MSIRGKRKNSSREAIPRRDVRKRATIQAILFLPVAPTALVKRVIPRKKKKVDRRTERDTI